MLLDRWSRKFRDSTRGRILALLRRSALTVDQIAGALALTDNAVRAQLATLERDGLIEQQIARRGGVGKPASVYRVVAGADELFSRAYVPILAQLLDVLADRLSREELDQLLRAVGERLATAQGATPASTERERAERATALLNELGGVADVEERDHALWIRGYACPLGAAVHGHPEVCAAIEEMLTRLIGAPVHEQCDRGERPACCFRVDAPTGDGAAPHAPPIDVPTGDH